MPIVLCNAAKAALIDLERVTLNACKLRLFINNVNPAGTDSLGLFTECTDTGYAPAGAGSGGVTPIGFTAGSLNGASQGQLLAPSITWTFTFSGGPFTVYGYYLEHPTLGLIYSERAATPFTVSGAGQTYTVVPKKVMDTM